MVYQVKPVNTNTLDTAEDFAALEIVNITGLDVALAKSADTYTPNSAETPSA